MKSYFPAMPSHFFIVLMMLLVAFVLFLGSCSSPNDESANGGNVNDDANESGLFELSFRDNGFGEGVIAEQSLVLEPPYNEQVQTYESSLVTTAQGGIFRFTSIGGRDLFGAGQEPTLRDSNGNIIVSTTEATANEWTWTIPPNESEFELALPQFQGGGSIQGIVISVRLAPPVALEANGRSIFIRSLDSSGVTVEIGGSNERMPAVEAPRTNMEDLQVSLTTPSIPLENGSGTSVEYQIFELVTSENIFTTNTTPSANFAYSLSNSSSPASLIIGSDAEATAILVAATLRAGSQTQVYRFALSSPMFDALNNLSLVYNDGPALLSTTDSSLILTNAATAVLDSEDTAIVVLGSDIPGFATSDQGRQAVNLIGNGVSGASGERFDPLQTNYMISNVISLPEDAGFFVLTVPGVEVSDISVTPMVGESFETGKTVSIFAAESNQFIFAYERGDCEKTTLAKTAGNPIVMCRVVVDDTEITPMAGNGIPEATTRLKIAVAVYEFDVEFKLPPQPIINSVSYTYTEVGQSDQSATISNISEITNFIGDLAMDSGTTPDIISADNLHFAGVEEKVYLLDSYELDPITITTSGGEGTLTFSNFQVGEFLGGEFIENQEIEILAVFSNQPPNISQLNLVQNTSLIASGILAQVNPPGPRGRASFSNIPGSTPSSDGTEVTLFLSGGESSTAYSGDFYVFQDKNCDTETEAEEVICTPYKALGANGMLYRLKVNFVAP